MTDEVHGNPAESGDADRRFETSRRRLMQVAGGLGATGFLSSSPAGAQESDDGVIRLDAIQRESRSDELNYDVNDDGEVGYADVVDLFENFEDPEIQDNPEAYDFNDNDRLDLDDPVTLFEEISDPGGGDGDYVWLGRAPEEISGDVNPTLSLTPGEQYTVEWTNVAGGENNFVIADGEGTELVSSDVVTEQGATQTVTFTASEEMAAYYSTAHPQTQRGTIEVGVPEPTEGMISVLFMGGPWTGSHNAPARQLQITEYMLNRGIEVFYTDRLADLGSDVLHDYDAWIMFDNRGANYGEALPDDLEESIVNFVEDGGGFVPIHSASACFTESEAYLDLVGAQFADHNYGEMTTEFAQPDHPILRNLDPITTEDETYRHMNIREDINVLAYAQFPEGDTIPEYDEGREQGEPWSWTRTQGDGRVFYTAWGHGRGPWADPGFKALIENAIRWVTGNEDTIADDTRVLDELEFTEANIPYFPPSEDGSFGLFTEEVPAEVGEGTDWQRMQRALDPEGTIERTITPEGFDLQPYVTEETLPEEMRGNILDAKFDERGRAWLAITRDYPNELGQGEDMIVVCEDTDGDGQADEFTRFAGDLSIPASMVLVDDGVVVAHFDEDAENAGKMVRILDTDGDGVGDERTTLFTGFGTGDTHAGPNELDHGIDNWIWGQVGYSGFSGTIAGEQRDFASSVYRFDVDDDGEVSDFQIVSELPGNQAGLDFTEEGLAFASAATTGRPSNYLPIPNDYYELIRGTEPTDFGAASDTNRFLPVTNRVRQVDRHGGYTAATSHAIYTAREYPEKYWNNTAFVGDGTGHILGTFFLQQDGAGYTNHYAHNLAGSTDAWFAPSYVENGPDGMMWFIDWYNYIYQHNPTPEGFETGPGNAYVTELRDHAVARLFRATYGDVSGYDPMSLADASPSELVDALENDNMFWRLKAQRMLVERNATGVVSDLASMVTSESVDAAGIDAGSIHALWTLDGLGALDADSGSSEAIGAATSALTHPSAGVRITALRTVPKTADTREAILDNDLLSDDDGRVAMWALIALAQTPSSEAAGEAVYRMISAEPNYEDTILVDAASIAAAQHADGFIPIYEENEDTSPPDPGDQPNVFENPSMEEAAGGGGGDPMPAGWSTTTYTGSAEFTYAETGYEGSRSVQVSSSEGADASWGTTVSVEPNTEYTYTAYVRTENLEVGSGSDVENSPYGATISVEPIANVNYPDIDQSVVGEPRLTGTNDWTEVTTTFNSGDNTELTLIMLFGGYGTATGTAWWDDVSLVGPDGNDVLSNGSFEQSATGGEAEAPAAWDSITYGGTAEFGYTSDVARSGEDSVTVSSAEGADASWTQTMDDLEPNAEYTFTAYVRTSDDFANSEDGFGEIGSSYGVTINTSLGEDTVGNYFTEPIEGWQQLETTIQTGANPGAIDFNLLYGGYGNATGTVWFDDASLRQTGGFGGGLQTVYDRVQTHVEMGDGGGDGDDDGSGGEPDVIDPSTQIEMVVESNEAFTGVAPASIEGTDNPTLRLQEGEEYTVVWTNQNGAPHNFEIVDSNDEVLQGVSPPLVTEEGATQTVTFTATQEIAEYVCRAHPTRMRGAVETSGGDTGGEGSD